MKVLLVSLFLIGLSYGDQYNEPKPTQLSCNCGWRNEVTTEEDTKSVKNRNPWMAAVLQKIDTEEFTIECGGSIITSWHVLSGSYCLRDVTANQIVVCVGVKNTNQCGSETNTIEVEEIINRDFDPKTLINDISILQTKTIIAGTKFVGPACFPKNAITSELDNKSLKLMGWGFSGDNDYGDDEITVISELDVNVLPWETCVTTHQGLDKKKTQFCHTATKGNPCGAEGGDPVVWLDSEVGRYTLVGLVSYGPFGCSTTSEPSINTNVTSFSSWILEKVAGKEGAVVCSKD